MPGIVCSGNLVLDILVRPVDQVLWGATTVVESIEQQLGGNGANTSFTLARLGIAVRLLGMVGADPFGDYLLARLCEAGVDTSGVRRSRGPTAGSVVLVKSDGDRLFLNRPGSSAEMFLEPGDFAAACRGMSHYHLGSPFGLPRLRPVQPELLRQARAAGLTTSLDTHWDSQGRWMADLGACLPHVDILFANEDETRMLTGTSLPSESARLLHDRGARTVVLKLSRSGCAVFTPEREVHSPAFRVSVVDTTGAGDCFAAGFLAALQRGGSWEEAARFANAVAALAIQRLGAVEGVRSSEETRAWMAAQPPPGA
jgi:sugar/nucleoside kinase (ribokinase family)